MGAHTAENLYGLLAEFESVHKLTAAADKVREAGYKAVDGFSPFPIEGLGHHLGIKESRLPLLVLIAGITGACCGFGLEAFTAAIDYPINIGGRPLVSVPSFIPVTFELTVLFAALTSAFGMIALNGLPRPYHPVFNVDRFKAASIDSFFICVEAKDPQFEKGKTAAFLKSAGAKEVFEVPE